MLTPLLATGAFVGGLFWVIKGGAILLGYRQPDYVFEVAPFLFALVTLGLARWVPRSRARNVAVSLAATAVVLCLVAVASYLVSGDVLGLGLGFGVLTMTIALVIVGLSLRGGGRALGALPFVLGAGTIPAVIVGGALSMIDERLLEVPIVVLGSMWMALGVALVRFVSSPPRPA